MNLGSIKDLKKELDIGECSIMEGKFMGVEEDLRVCRVEEDKFKAKSVSMDSEITIKKEKNIFS